MKWIYGVILAMALIFFVNPIGAGDVSIRAKTLIEEPVRRGATYVLEEPLQVNGEGKFEMRAFPMKMSGYLVGNESWISFDPTSISLVEGQSEFISVKIHVSRCAKQGKYVFLLAIGPPMEPSTGQATVRHSVANKCFFEVQGDAGFGFAVGRFIDKYQSELAMLFVLLLVGIAVRVLSRKLEIQVSRK